MDYGFGGLLPARSVEDVLAERVRVLIGDEVYTLGVLSIAENREWKERMDLELGYLLLRITGSDDGEAILRMFDGAEQVFLDLLVSYDRQGVLPPRDELERRMTQMGLVRAVLEVWRAARPLADIARIGMDARMAAETTPTQSWRQRMSSRLRRTAGRPESSSAS